MPVEPVVCEACGGRLAGGDHAPCRAGRRYDPPRFCPTCGRRLLVQVRPAGWSARCSRCGPYSGDPGGPGFTGRLGVPG